MQLRIACSEVSVADDADLAAARESNHSGLLRRAGRLPPAMESLLRLLWGGGGASAQQRRRRGGDEPMAAPQLRLPPPANIAAALSQQQRTGLRVPGIHRAIEKRLNDKHYRLPALIGELEQTFSAKNMTRVCIAALPWQPLPLAPSI